MRWIIALCAAAGWALPAQTFTSLASFNNAFGIGPVMGVVQGTDGDFYGTATSGGANVFCGTSNTAGCGTVYKIDRYRNVTILYNFCANGGALCIDGSSPDGMILAPDGDFYGTTSGGGVFGGCEGFAIGCGTVFKITATGTLTTLYSFCSAGGACPDGKIPLGGLVRSAGGEFYGTTLQGGAYGQGTVFKITAAGALTTLYSFCPQPGCADGREPAGTLIQATNGDFYGITGVGGLDDSGTVFSITPWGSLTTLYRFCAEAGCADGKSPVGGVIEASNGEFYGTTWSGGICGGSFNGDCGTVYKLTGSGKLTTLYSFCSEGGGCADGLQPLGGLVQATDHGLYGTTASGGAHGGGTIFSILPGKPLTTLYNFCSQQSQFEICTDGSYAEAALIQATDGNLYGSTYLGGDSGYGTLFMVSVGLSPFVTTTATAGPIGAIVSILGNNLTGATAVTFNRSSAPFYVVASSLILTQVPNGATSGTVKVSTANGTLSSNRAFRVVR